MSTLTAAPDTFMKLLHKIPDLSEAAVKRTWKMVSHTKNFTSEQKQKLTNALKNNNHITRRRSDAGGRTRGRARGRKSRGRKSRGRKSRGRKSRGRKSRGRARGRKSRGRKRR